MDESEIDEYISGLTNISNKTPYARKFYLELIKEDFDINSLITRNEKLNSIVKGKLPEYIADNKFLTPKDAELYQRYNLKDIFRGNIELSINNLGISLKKEIEDETPNIKEILRGKSNGIYIGKSYDHIFNAKVLLAPNNEHLVLIHSGLLQTCYFLSHIAFANMKIYSGEGNLEQIDSFPEAQLRHYCFSFFRKLIRTEEVYNTSELKFSPTITNLIVMLTSSAEKFIIKHEYSHVINGDLESSDKETTAEQRELLADEVAVKLVLSCYQEQKKII